MNTKEGSTHTIGKIGTLSYRWRSHLAEIEALDPDVYRTLVRCWEDVLDRYDWTDDDEAGFETDLYDALQIAQEGC